MTRVRVSVEEIVNKSNQGDGSLGIKCKKCHCVQFSDGKNVRNTVKGDGQIKRYRVCRSCGHTFVTHER